MRLLHPASALILAAVFAIVAPLVSYAETNKIVMADPFPPKADWAMETDDAFSLSRVGCIEGLARIDFSGKLQPSLATSWKQSSPTSWDFSIRQSVTFHDGQELNAAAVVNSLNHVLSADAPARAFNSKIVSSVEEIDANTVRISTHSPSVLLPYRLAAPNTGILSPAAYSERKVNPVEACTGPFVVKEIVQDQYLNLVRNESYWGGPVAIAEAEVRYITDANARATQARSGEVHIGRIIPIAARQSLAAVPELKVHVREVPRTMSMYLNNKRPPFDDARIRKAVQAAVDIRAIAASIYEGFARPAIGPFAPDEPWAADIEPAAYDVDRAKALLAEAGIQPGDLKLEIRTYSSRAELKDVAAVIQQQLKQVGIEAEVIVTDWSGAEPHLFDATYDMFLMSRGHQLDVADPVGFLQADYTCEGGFNVTHFCDPEVDALLEKATGLADELERHDIYRNVSRMLQEEAVNVFIVHEQSSDAVSTEVQNYRIHPLNHYYLTRELSLTPM